MARLVDSIDDIEKNIKTLERYRIGNDAEQQFHASRIKNGRLFVTMQSDNGYLFAPSKFAGYRDNTISHLSDLNNRDGRVTNRCISSLLGRELDVGAPLYLKIEKAFLKYCGALRIIPSKHRRNRRYWVLPIEGGNSLLPEEIIEPKSFYEGALLKITINRYERDLNARKACLSHYGHACTACHLDFAERYGALGAGYIHVHHLVPLSAIKRSYRVDPIKDLRPVCPNCHAMLHVNKAPMTIAALQRLLAKQKNTRDNPHD